MFLKLGPASLSLSSVKFGKGGYAVFRNEHFHFGVAVQELPFWFCTLFRFRGHCHFLVKQTLGIHFRRNPLSRNSWRKRDPVSKEKDDTYPISRNGSEARRSRFFCSLPLVPTLLRTAAPLPVSQCCLRCERYWICSVSKRAFPFWCCSPRIAILVLHSFSFQRSLSLFGKTNSRDTFPTQSIVS